jgi:hypothetical protein
MSAWLLVCAFALAIWLVLAALLVNLRSAGLPRRPGGSSRRRASVRMKGGGRLQPATATTVRISSYSLRGARLAVTDIRARLAPPNRPTVPTLSGSETAAPGANGVPVRAADSPDPRTVPYLDGEAA